MDPQTVKVVVVGVVLFTIFGGVPIILALLSHQQKMAELFAKNSLDSSELKGRLDLMEQKLSALQPPPVELSRGAPPLAPKEED
jgi:hypothetical protein